MLNPTLMDIGKEDEDYRIVKAPREVPEEQPLTIPAPEVTPAPVEVPAGV